jgi:hypothetical protein
MDGIDSSWAGVGIGGDTSPDEPGGINKGGAVKFVWHFGHCTKVPIKFSGTRSLLLQAGQNITSIRIENKPWFEFRNDSVI